MTHWLLRCMGVPLLVAGLIQEASAIDTQACGLYVSNLAGSGLSYHRQLDSGWGYRVTGLGWAQSGTGYINLGGAVTRELDRRSWGQLYSLCGFGISVDGFAGGAGMVPAWGAQVNVAPGLGATWGPFFLEAGLSIYHHPGGFGLGPAGGMGAAWWF